MSRFGPSEPDDPEAESYTISIGSGMTVWLEMLDEDLIGCLLEVEAEVLLKEVEKDEE